MCSKYDTTTVLSENVSAASVARDFTEEALARIGYLGRADEVVMAVSELVSNALLHGWGAPVLRLAGCAHHVRIEVADDSPVLPVVRLDAGPDGGWGLRLISRFAEWGTSPRVRGKIVWCEVGVESAVPHAPGGDEALPVAGTAVSR